MNISKKQIKVKRESNPLGVGCLVGSEGFLFVVGSVTCVFSFLALLLLRVGGADGVGESVQRSPNHPPASPDGCSCRFPGVLADLCGDLHFSRINFKSEKVCRSEKNLMWAEGVSLDRAGNNRFGYSGSVVEVGSLILKHRPGVKS
jgi:hypothetical protein